MRMAYWSESVRIFLVHLLLTFFILQCQDVFPRNTPFIVSSASEPGEYFSIRKVEEETVNWPTIGALLSFVPSSGIFGTQLSLLDIRHVFGTVRCYNYCLL